MADTTQSSSGSGGSAWIGFFFLALLMSLGAWGGWAARGKMDVCSDRPNYNALNLVGDAASSTYGGIKYVAVGTWDGMSGLYRKAFDKAPAAAPAAPTKH
jgi:hypothetical protein